MQSDLSRKRPVVGVLACRKMVEPNWSHAAAEKYLVALSSVADVMPLIVPSLQDDLCPEMLFDRLDGLLLPGSVSNIEPFHYSDNPVDDTDIRDTHRDSTALKIIQAAIRTKKPVFGICRGFQEINVALGGSLYQRVAELEDKLDHREPADKLLDEQFSIAHDVSLVRDGFLHSTFGQETVSVNSLHEQGVRTLGENLIIEAVAPDGLIEAFRYDTDESLILGVQWHPEWHTVESAFYTSIFRAFGDACRRD